MSETIRDLPQPPATRGSALICTVVAAAMIAGGAWSFSAAGGTTVVVAAAMHLVAWSTQDLAATACLALFLVIGLGSVAFGERFFEIAFASLICLMAFGFCAVLAATCAIGWGRFLGFQLFERLPALSEPELGVSALAMAVGATVLTWCRFPASLASADGTSGNIARKVQITAAVGLALIFVPGLIAGPSKEPPADFTATSQDPVLEQPAR